jgi:hypothetical protein
MNINIGDLLEWLAAACLVAATSLFVGLALALVVAGVCLVWFAQCHARDEVTLGRRDRGPR